MEKKGGDAKKETLREALNRKSCERRGPEVERTGGNVIRKGLKEEEC